jgi:hypothetical protein
MYFYVCNASCSRNDLRICNHTPMRRSQHQSRLTLSHPALTQLAILFQIMLINVFLLVLIDDIYKRIDLTCNIRGHVRWSLEALGFKYVHKYLFIYLFEMRSPNLLEHWNMDSVRLQSCRHLEADNVDIGDDCLCSQR